jgi:hypothetical protein
MAQCPKDACIPPWAAEEWDRLAGTILRQMVSKPAVAVSMATRSPASPAPTHKTSVNMVSNGIPPHILSKRKRIRVIRPMLIKIAVR